MDHSCLSEVHGIFTYATVICHDNNSNSMNTLHFEMIISNIMNVDVRNTTLEIITVDPLIT